MNPFDKYNNQDDVVAIDKWLAQQQALNTKSKGKKKQAGKGGTLTSLISEGGALGGAATGAAIGSVVPGIGTAIGGIIGGGIGAFGGRVAENKVRDNRLGLGDAAKEGAMTAVLSGPLKLAKYGTTAAKVAKGGATLEEALAAAAAKTSAKGSVSKAIGGKLQAGSDNLATRALKLNGSTFNTDFANKTGEEVGQFATRHGLIDKTVPEIRKNIYEPAQKVYAAGVKAIGDIPKADVRKTIENELAPKLTSKFPEDKAFAQSVLKQADEVLKGYGDKISATELNNLKTAAYKKVNTKFVDKSGVDSNKLYDTLSNSFRKAVGDAADKAGIEVDPTVLKQAGLNFKGGKLSELGSELNHMNELVKQLDVKSRVGKGSSIFGLSKSNAGIGGAVLGGPAGFVAGAAGATIANSPKVAGKLTNVLDKAGANMVGKAGQIGIPGAVKNTAKGAVGSSLVDSILGAGQSESGNSMNDMNATDTNSMNMPNAAMGELSQTGQDMSSTSGSPYTRENLMADLQRDPKNAAKYLDYYSQLQEIFAPADANTEVGYGKPTVQQFSQATTGNGSVDSLAQQLMQNPNLVNQNATPGQNLPGIGGVVSRAAGTSTYRATANNILNSIARINTGAAMPASEEAFYARTYLPQPGDPPETVAAKLQQLKQFFAPITNYKAAKTGSSSLEDALLAQGVGN